MISSVTKATRRPRQRLIDCHALTSFAKSAHSVADASLRQRALLKDTEMPNTSAAAFEHDLTHIASQLQPVDANTGHTVAEIVRDTWLRGMGSPAPLAFTPVAATKPLTASITAATGSEVAIQQIQQLSGATSGLSGGAKGSRTVAQIAQYGSAAAKESARRDALQQLHISRAQHFVDIWETLDGMDLRGSLSAADDSWINLRAAIAVTSSSSADSDAIDKIIRALKHSCHNSRNTNDSPSFGSLLERVCQTASPSAIALMGLSIAASAASSEVHYDRKVVDATLKDLSICLAAYHKGVDDRLPLDGALGMLEEIVRYLGKHLATAARLTDHSDAALVLLQFLLKANGQSFATILFVHDKLSEVVPALTPSVIEPTSIALTYQISFLSAVVAIGQRNVTTSVVATTLISEVGDRHIAPEALRAATIVMDTLATIFDSHICTDSPASALVVQQCKEGLGIGLALLAQSDPSKVLELRRAHRVPLGPFVVDSLVSSGELDGALGAIKEIGGSRPDGWSNPPASMQSALQRLSLAIGRHGNSRHIATLTEAIYSFKCPNLWLAVFHDHVTIGIALRVRRHSEECAKIAHTLYAVDELENAKEATDKFISEMRDAIKGLAMQRSADVNADPLLELLQECVWHPERVALIALVVEYHEHLFACYPRRFQHKALLDVPKEHRSRSKGFNTQQSSPSFYHEMTLVGSFLQHSVLCFLRDNKLITSLKALAQEWRIPNKDTARLLNRQADVAPATQLWECRQCNRLNNARYMYCSCSALRFASIMCPGCGLGQPETNAACVACGTDFIVAEVPTENIVPRVPWSCSGCGAANSPYQTIFCCKCQTATGPLAAAFLQKDKCKVCNVPHELGFTVYPVCVECGTKSPAFDNSQNSGAATQVAPAGSGAKAWQCDSCGLWAPTTIARCPHCAYVELRGASRVRDIAPITCSICGALNSNSLQAKCEECDSDLEGNLPTTVDVCTECFTSNSHNAETCVGCDASLAVGSDGKQRSRISVKAYYRYCTSCQRSVSPYNLSCVCDMCDSYLPYYTTPDGTPIHSVAPNAVGIVATCETILRRLDKETDAALVPVIEGFLMELTASTPEAIHVARPLLTDVVVHLGQLFTLTSIAGCRGLALTLSLAHQCGCEITEGKLVELDSRVIKEISQWANKPAWFKHDESVSSIASYVQGTSSSATAHNTSSMLFSAAVLRDESPVAGNAGKANTGSPQRGLTFLPPPVEDESDSKAPPPAPSMCNNCLSPHPESMCRFNPAGWECTECGKKLTNSNGLDGVMCPSCYQVRPELDNCLEVWVCPNCSRCSPETENFCIHCNSHKCSGGDEEVIVLPFLPVACGRCGRPHLEAHCPSCTAVPPTRVSNGSGTVSLVTDRYVFIQPMGTCGPDHRVFVPVQLAGELFEGQSVTFDAEEGKPGQLKATKVAAVDE